MRVLYYVSGISPTIGGIEKFILNYFDSREDNVEIEILTRYFDNSTKVSKLFSDRDIKIFTLGIHHLNASTFLLFRNELNSFFMNNVGKYDVLHIHCIEDPFVTKIARRYGIKRIITHVHSYPDRKINLTNTVKKLSAFFNSTYADVCLACSKDVGIATYPPKCTAKFLVLNNGIDAKKFKFNANIRSKYRRELGIDGYFAICNVARMEPIKNQEFLLDILKCLLEDNNKTVLILVGDGKLKEELLDKANKLNLQRNVLFLGERNDVSGILQASDAFILPSKNEGLGIAAIEAQAAGLKTFVSLDAVPNSVDCTGLVTFIGLHEPADKWANIVLEEAGNYYRKNQYELICKNGFDSGSTSAVLSDIYYKG